MNGLRANSAFFTVQGLRPDLQETLPDHVLYAWPERVAAIETNGDGACAGHSVTGTPAYNAATKQMELHDPSIRQKLVWKAPG